MYASVYGQFCDLGVQSSNSQTGPKILTEGAPFAFFQGRVQSIPRHVTYVLDRYSSDEVPGRPACSVKYLALRMEHLEETGPVIASILFRITNIGTRIAGMEEGKAADSNYASDYGE